MDQEHEDYDDEPHRKRHPWTALEKAMLVLIVAGLLPILNSSTWERQ
jgi:hypothetical protein